MFHSLKTLTKFRVVASDGEFGDAEDFLFDAASWTVRYLVGKPERGPVGRRILIPRMLIGRPDLARQQIPIGRDLATLASCPALRAGEPISRYYEAEVMRILSANPHTAGESLRSGFPIERRDGDGAWGDWPPEAYDGQTLEHDLRLRSGRELIGYDVHAQDGEAGRVLDSLAGDHDWNIRYVAGRRGDLFPGKRYLLASNWVVKIDWGNGALQVDVTRAAIDQAPAYDARSPIDRTYEELLHRHFGRAPYWRLSRAMAAGTRG